MTRASRQWPWRRATEARDRPQPGQGSPSASWKGHGQPGQPRNDRAICRVPATSRTVAMRDDETRSARSDGAASRAVITASVLAPQPDLRFGIEGQLLEPGAVAHVEGAASPGLDLVVLEQVLHRARQLQVVDV